MKIKQTTVDDIIIIHGVPDLISLRKSFFNKQVIVQQDPEEKGTRIHKILSIK